MQVLRGYQGDKISTRVRDSTDPTVVTDLGFPNTWEITAGELAAHRRSQINQQNC
jgi:hypothetical protein